MYAEDLSYWKTSQSSPDSWMDKTKKIIESFKGKVMGEGFGSNDQGKTAYMFAFEIQDETFKVIWPVVKSYAGNERAERIQAATSLYHYVKGVCLYALVVGFRAAFFSHLMLPGGKIASQIANEDLENEIPQMLLMNERKFKMIEQK